jgi:hypothetical protein
MVKAVSKKSSQHLPNHQKLTCRQKLQLSTILKVLRFCKSINHFFTRTKIKMRHNYRDQNHI